MPFSVVERSRHSLTCYKATQQRGSVGPEEAEVADSSRQSKAAEGRRSQRVRTFLQARISYGEGAISTACTVNQLSDSGARINIASAFSLPETFDIVIPQRGISRRADWFGAKTIRRGLIFSMARRPSRPRRLTIRRARIKALEAENAKLKTQIGALDAASSAADRRLKRRGDPTARVQPAAARLFHRSTNRLNR